jgi:sugar phosphate isomerase/epimerase
MRPVGYSTGALAPGDVLRALSMLRGGEASAIELSALRLAELAPLAALLPTLDVSRFTYVSVHAPSRFTREEEAGVADALFAAVPRGWPIVLHPDTIHDAGAWRQFGKQLAIENMDRRKASGRTARELGRVFDALPEASFCFDVGHAHQVDRTMNDALLLLRELGARLGQVHVSEVTPAGRHEPLGRETVTAFQKIAAWVPDGVPLILEAPAGPGELEAQMRLAGEALRGGEGSTG